ncbi:MAG: AsnC family protein [Rhodospirillales bacterium]|nr:AsnC family protein [Rhodospirillales bacterium]MBN8897451.1 AsnC family protein [Rhodospirillales bacterium]
MPKKIEWTQAQDLQIRRMRAEGASWDAIAAVLGITRWTVIERGRRIGARRPPPDFRPAPESPSRDPLPAGHPRSWGVLTQGTVLEGTPYPMPVFTR